MMSKGQPPDLMQRQAVVKSYRSIQELIEPHWSEGKVLANGIHHYYYRTGGEKPALVLLHGFQESGLCWMRVAKVLEQDYDVIMIDARGHGRSDGIATGFSSELVTEDTAGVMRALKLDKPKLLGHSMGGLTAAMVAVSYPELVHSLLLEDPPDNTSTTRGQIANSEGYKSWLNSWLAWFEHFKTLPYEEQLVSALTQLPPGAPLWSEDEYVSWVDAYTHLDSDLVKLGMSLWSQKSTPVSELLPGIACPVLLMKSSTPFPVFGPPLQSVREVDSAWPNVQIVRFENTGHLIHREQFEQFMRVVMGFLREQ